MEPEPTADERLTRIKRNALRQLDDRLAQQEVPVGELVEVLKLLREPTPAPTPASG